MRALHYRRAIAIVGSLLLALVVGSVWGVNQLTDARLTKWAADALNAHLSGHFSIASVHYGFPARVAIDDLKAHSPAGSPVLTIDRVRVQARLWPLLIGRMIVDEVTIDGVRADVVLATEKQKSEFVKTFIPDFELPALRNISTPIRLDIRKFSLTHGDVVIRGTGDARARLRDMRVADANVWMKGDDLRSNLAWEALASGQTGDVTVETSTVRVRLEDARMHFASFKTSLSALKADFPGFASQIAGETQLGRNGDMDAHIRGDITVDTGKFLPKVKRLDALKKAVRGSATMHFAGQHTGQHGQIKLALAQHDLQVQWLPLKEVTISVGHDRGDIDIEAFRIGLGEGCLEGHGTLALGSDPNVPLAEHNISLKAHAMPIRELARPWVALPALLPEAISFAVVSQGRALWPPTSQVDVDIVPEGLPGEDWPGLPKAMELKGRFLTHPDLLEILKLEAYIDNVPDFAIQGALPMHEQSVLDIIHELHGPHPKSPLQRIPVAPTDKRP